MECRATEASILNLNPLTLTTTIHPRHAKTTSTGLIYRAGKLENIILGLSTLNRNIAIRRATHLRIMLKSQQVYLWVVAHSCIAILGQVIFSMETIRATDTQTTQSSTRCANNSWPRPQLKSQLRILKIPCSRTPSIILKRTFWTNSEVKALNLLSKLPLRL